MLGEKRVVKLLPENVLYVIYDFFVSGFVAILRGEMQNGKRPLVRVPLGGVISPGTIARPLKWGDVIEVAWDYQFPHMSLLEGSALNAEEAVFDNLHCPFLGILEYPGDAVMRRLKTELAAECPIKGIEENVIVAFNPAEPISSLTTIEEIHDKYESGDVLWWHVPDDQAYAYAVGEVDPFPTIQEAWRAIEDKPGIIRAAIHNRELWLDRGNGLEVFKS